jgi:hypothetical protein
MYLTPFAYQFFIYNSLYQVDWPTSISANKIKHLKKKEVPCQRDFLMFLKQHGCDTPNALLDAFVEVENFDLVGGWTKIQGDVRISEKEGDKFFTRLRDFQRKLRALREATQKGDGDEDNNRDLLDSASASTFDHLPKLTTFVYSVRCNIFHGRKRLADAFAENQNRRIEVYFRVLQGVVTLFFKLVA